MIKIIDNPHNRYIYWRQEYNAPWITLSACCQSPVGYGLGGATCSKCKKDCNTIGYSDMMAVAWKQQKQETAEYAKRKDEHKMAVKLVTMEERKMPRSKVGKFTGLDDVKQALAHLSQLPAGKAVEITLEAHLLESLRKDGTKDAARSIVNMLKRKFTNDGLPYKAYASDEKTITILKAPAKGGKK